MATTAEIPLVVSISDGNLMEKYVDWLQSFQDRVKKFGFDKLQKEKEAFAHLNTMKDFYLYLDMKIGLDAEHKQTLVENVNSFERSLCKHIERTMKKRKEKKRGTKVNAVAGSKNNEKQPKDSKAEESTSKSENQVACNRCGYHCKNYKRCPALGKECRKCGVLDHYEKFCKKPALASVSDENLIEKWIDWKKSVKIRMHKYNLFCNQGALTFFGKIQDYEKEVLRTDKKIELSKQQKQELVDFMHEMEFDLRSNIDALERLVEKKGTESTSCDAGAPTNFDRSSTRADQIFMNLKSSFMKLNFS